MLSLHKKTKGFELCTVCLPLGSQQKGMLCCTRHLVANSSANIGKNSIGFAGSRAFIPRTLGHRCPAPKALPWKKNSITQLVKL
jgi:hypothetical protein